MQDSTHLSFEQILTLIMIAIGVIIAALIYALPTILAFRRQHPNRWFIAVLNIVFGYTLLGWLVALVWALKAFHLGASGAGESGLNLFVSDVRKVQLVPPPPLPPPASPPPTFTITAELEKLHRLLQDQVINQTEFEMMKARLLGGSAS